ncbi:ATP-binding protein [Tardiphaga sp. 813_E8_N1_3]|uniref:ATP-binding protein n=1 Tax=Tardiphaga sp. 813_E8_N1_3 TaxID=3240760 RepID=UPI003F1FDC8E
MTPRSDQTFVFGPFRLHAGRHTLLRGELPVSLGARALEILIALAERAGELVTKDELVARAWPDVVVDESNLRAQISLLRKTLGDGEAGVRYITAVPGRGYRFVAPVVLTGLEGATTNATDRRTDLPQRLARLIGRETALSAVKARFQRYRLITIVGPGGIGKTALCLTLAEELASRGSTCFLDLGPIADPALLPSALASALGLSNAAENPLPRVLTFVRLARMLIVFDSCDRVVEAAADLAEVLLREAPDVRILATSREALRAAGESVYRLSALEAPPLSAGLSAIEALTYPAVQLFVERATSSATGFELDDDNAPVISDICRQLDGIALAIELAASRIEAFGARGVARRLDDRFRLLTGGRRSALPRHQTLRATLDWSYETLPKAEQTLLQRLAVFQGEFSFDGAAAVMIDVEADGGNVSDGLANLIAKSLVSVCQSEHTPYRLLDTTRAYALEALVENEAFNSAMQRLAEYLTLTLTRGLGDIETLSGPAWLDLYGGVVNDVRVALEWAYSGTGNSTVGTALTVAAIPLWFQMSSVDECRDGVQRALSNIPSKQRREVEARNVMQLYMALGLASIFTIGLAPQASAAWIKAREIAEDLRDVEEELQALWGLWFCQMGMGNYRAALETGAQFCRISEAGVDLPPGDRLIGMPLFCIGDISGARFQVDRMLGRSAVRKADPSFVTRFKFDQVVSSRVLFAQLLWLQGFSEQSARAAERSVEDALASNHAISICDAISRGTCAISLFSGDLASAERSIAQLQSHATKHALHQWEVFGRCWKGSLLIEQGDADHGVRLIRLALDELLKGSLLVHFSTVFLGALAKGLVATGLSSEGLATVEAAITRAREKEEQWYLAELYRLKGELMLVGNSKSAAAAERNFTESIQWARRQGALSWELRGATSLARLHQSRGLIELARDELIPVCEKFSEGFETPDFAAAKAVLDGCGYPAVVMSTK